MVSKQTSAALGIDAGYDSDAVVVVRLLPRIEKMGLDFSFAAAVIL
jgi:hypothetical protein